MIESKCECRECVQYEAIPKSNLVTKIGPPRKPEHVPGQFKWKPMLAAEKYWTYLVTCKLCKWEKFSDYYNVQDWMWFHHAEDCKNPSKRWTK